mmetsp:Transcript_100704/g.225736  ORF Transcript_100704/g.225736 Transcript_100704/m.225736 type:complete len:214 (-) Transcript_100704:133-774(-)
MSPLPVPESPGLTPLVQPAAVLDKRCGAHSFSHWPDVAELVEATGATPCSMQFAEQPLGKLPDCDIATTGTNDSGPNGAPSSTWDCSDSSTDISRCSEITDDSALLGSIEAFHQALPTTDRSLTHSKSEQAMAVLAPDPLAVPRPELGRPPRPGGDSKLFASILVSPLGSPAGPNSLALSTSLELSSFAWTPAPGGLSLDVADADHAMPVQSC